MGRKRTGFDKAAYCRAYAKQHRLDNQAWIQGMKTGSCQDCGQTYPPCVMDFDHRGDKKHNIGNMKTYSRKTIRVEIAKCDLVCANCHRLRTEARRGTN